MLLKKAPDVLSSEITPQGLYVRRREFLHAAGVAIAAGLTGGWTAASHVDAAQTGSKLVITRRGRFATDERQTPYKDVTSYNNFYELGMDKDEPARVASTLKTRPWTVKVDGLVNKPASYPIDDLITPHALEERIYRMRCVEGWSMVIPWVGFPLGDLIKRVEPQSKARFVEFTTLYNPTMLPGQRRQTLDYPYVEGLRLDEAIHPLTILAVGLYGEVLPNQNGAPLRLVVPWKYGFKGIKSIVRIRFTEKTPINSWQRANPTYYGFYANVNPTVDTPLVSPRHLQARERRLGDLFMRPTLMFNGYADQVASLYAGMDLKKNF